MMKKLTFVVPLIGSLAVAAHVAHAGVRTYHVTDLGDGNPDFHGAQLAAVNAAGLGAGSVGGTPALFDHGNIQWLPNLLANGGGTATGLDDSGVVVGTSAANLSPWTTHAVRWTQGVVEDLGTLAKKIPTASSEATAINAKGQVCGDSDVTDGPYPLKHAFIVVNGKMKDMGTPDWADSAVCQAINDKGHFAGYASLGIGGTNQAVLFRNGAYVRLRDPGNGSQPSFALGINSKDLVVGMAYFDAQPAHHAFLWSKGAMQDLGGLPGFNDYPGWAHAINGSGVIVGDAGVGFNVSAAFVRFPGGKLKDLNKMLDASGAGWYLSGASAINESGQIVGYGTLNDQIRLFLLTPNP